MKRFYRILAVVACLAGVASPALAERPTCTCKNLESLQQEYQNAVYLEGYMRQLSAHLQEVEAAQTDLNQNHPEHKDAGVSVHQVSATARDAYKKAKLRLPFPKVTGYTGPTEVSMTEGTCEQPKGQLEAMESGSPCAAIAEALVTHERTHRDLCESLGKDAYWTRLPSEIALEEVAMYKAQAEKIKRELQVVLDAADVRLRGEWRHTLSGQGVELVYFYQFESQDIAAVSQGGDSWAMTGTGETQNAIESMKFPGASCRSTGSVRNAFTVSIATDGLTFGLDYADKNTGGDLTIKCDGGMSIAMPTGDASSGRLVSGQILKAGDNVIPNSWADSIMALASSEGMSITGEPKTVLSVTCEKP